jgi:Spy/CpxP family protein refolding chaperone
VKSSTLTMAAILVLAAAAGLPTLQAQPLGRPKGMPPGGLELRRELFPPELVMRHQAEIALGEEQRTALVREMQAMQSDLVPLQFEMSDAAGKLRAALDMPRVDEDKASALADRLMSLETRIKKRHLALMIRIKNILTPEQQSRLRELREQAAARRGGAEGRRGDMGRRPRPPEEDDEPSDDPMP